MSFHGIHFILFEWAQTHLAKGAIDHSDFSSQDQERIDSDYSLS